MISDTPSTAPDPAEHPLSVAGVRLAEIVESAGPYGSLFIGPGSGLRSRAQVAIDAVPIPAPHAGMLLSTIEESQTQSQVAICDGRAVWRFLLDDPLSIDLARFDEIPSLGPIIEASQVTTPHVAVTIEDDVYAITSFGAVDSAPAPTDDESAHPAELTVLEALDHLVDALRVSGVRLVALVGSGEAVDALQGHLQKELPFVRCNAYPTDDIDRDLMTIADDVVKDAASMAAERRTHELAHFREARSAALTVEGAAAIGALEGGTVQRLLVHDGLGADGRSKGPRNVDRAIVAAIRSDVPITMIPDVPDDRGPKEGLGVIVKGDGTAVPASAADPEDVDHVQLKV